jgi:recombination protein RecR
MEALLAALQKLPGVGPRTAERYVFYLLTQPASVARELSDAILRAKQTIGFCSVCFNLADEELCAICRDPHRDRSVICVVEDHRSIRAIEKGGRYKGTYHVLLGALSPLEGVSPKDLKIQELKARIQAGLPAGEKAGLPGRIREVILATDSDLEGETTALYLTRELKALFKDLKITRLAFGLPMGSNVEYADQVTLTRALEGRRAV